MRKLLFAVLIVAAVLAVGAVKVGFIYVGPVGDAGWTYAHDLGRRYLEEHVPGVITDYIESVPEGEEAYRVIVDFIKKGYKIIFTTSFGYMDPTAKAAKEYPNVHFFHCSGYKYNHTNFSAYFGRMYQARFLTGIVAGMMTKSNIIGYVAAFPIPEVIRGINAFALGVKLVNPKAKVHVVWTRTWYNPAAEREAAISLLDSGADVITQHQDSPAPVQAAAERGKYAIGYDSDMSIFAPEAHLTAPIWHWGVFYEAAVKGILNGTWKHGFYWWGMDKGIVDIAPFGPAVPDKVKAVVNAFKELIVEGKFDPFTGPIYDQSGKLRVEKGVRMSDDALLSMNWFVDNVVGSIPKEGEK